MDQATAAKIAQNYGVPPTPQNLSLIMQEAPNESALLGRSMGLQGGAGQEGYDDSILKSRLNKVSDDTLPKGRVEVGQPQVEAIAPASTVNNPDTKVPARLGKPAETARMSTPGSRGDELNSDTPSTPTRKTPLSGYETEPDVSATNAPEGGGGIGPWLMALLGISAAGRSASGTPISAPAQLTGPGNVPRLEGPPTALPGPNARNQIAGGGPAAPQLGYEPKLNAPANNATYPSGAPDNTAGPTQPSSPESAAAGNKPVRKAPVRPEFNSTEMLQDALINFRKMFRK